MIICEACTATMRPGQIKCDYCGTNHNVAHSDHEIEYEFPVPNHWILGNWCWSDCLAEIINQFKCGRSVHSLCLEWKCTGISVQELRNIELAR